MARHRRRRLASPAEWLIAGLFADLASYLTDALSGVVPWLSFDLWLAHRIWRGGLFALTTLRVLQAIGACLFASSWFWNWSRPGW